MKKLLVILILLLVIGTPSHYADVTTNSLLNRALANALYCQLVGCTMTGGLTMNLNASATAFALTSPTDAPATAMTAALKAATPGVLSDGDYSYKVTFVTATGETTGSAISNVVTVVDHTVAGQIVLTAIPLSPDPAVTSRKIYRTEAGGSTYKLQSTIADNSSTTAPDDNIADAALGAVMPTTNTTIDPRLSIGNDGSIDLGLTTLGPEYPYGGTWNSGASIYADMSASNALTLFDTRAMGAAVGPYLSFAARTKADGTYTDLAAISGQKLNATEANTDGQLSFQYNSGGSPVVWYMNTTNFNPSNDNQISFGGSVNQLKNVYVGTNVILGPAKPTAGTMTATNVGVVRSTVQRYDWTNAMITALGAGGTGDITVCTLPAKTVVRGAYIVIDTPDTSANALTISLGITGATYLDYIGNSNAKAAANTVYGDLKTELGAKLYDAATLIPDLNSVTATTIVKAHFIKTTTGLNTVTGSTGHIYLTTETLP